MIELKKKVLIIDDHPMMAKGIAANLKSIPTIEIVAIRHNGQACLDFIDDHQVDLILMDIEMPVMNGIECAKVVKNKYHDIKIIILSMFQEKSLVESFIQIGINGYLLKTTDEKELTEAVIMVLNGQDYFQKDLLDQSETKSHLSTIPSFKASEEAARLTEREVEIITLISKGYSNDKMADTLFISSRTVETHRSNIMRKTKTKKVAELIRFAFQNGII